MRNEDRKTREFYSQVGLDALPQYGSLMSAEQGTRRDSARICA